MTRAVAITQAQIKAVEEIAFDLIRDRKQDEAARLLAICLAWKVSPKAAFECHIDESGGLAEVYDLDTHSRRVGA